PFIVWSKKAGCVLNGARPRRTGGALLFADLKGQEATVAGRRDLEKADGGRGARDSLRLRNRRYGLVSAVLECLPVRPVATRTGAGTLVPPHGASGGIAGKGLGPSGSHADGATAIRQPYDAGRK